MHHIFSSDLLIAIPRAIEDECPIDPTVKKSFLCDIFLFFLISNSSLLALPVVETITLSFATSTIFFIISSRFSLLSFLYSIIFSNENAFSFAKKATLFPFSRSFFKSSIFFNSISSVVSFVIVTFSICIKSIKSFVILP